MKLRQSFRLWQKGSFPILTIRSTVQPTGIIISTSILRRIAFHHIAHCKIQFLIVKISSGSQICCSNMILFRPMACGNFYILSFMRHLSPELPWNMEQCGNFPFRIMILAVKVCWPTKQPLPISSPMPMPFIMRGAWG